MTSRRSRPRRSSGSRATSASALAALVAAALASLADPLAAVPEALVAGTGGLSIDWAAGVVTASGGGAADLHLPSAELARPGAVRRAEAVARERLGRALADLPLGGGRRLSAQAVARAVGHARTTGTDYQSNGGALVRVTARFVDWIEPAPAPDAPVVATLSVAAMHLQAAPLAKIGEAEHALGAAVYRLGAPPADVKTVPAKIDRAGRLVIEGKHGALAEKLASGATLIYVG